MKLQLVLFTLLFMPLLIKGQTSTPESVVFYSKGKMHVKYRAGSGDDVDGSKSKSTTLYIKGSSEFADGSGIVQKGRTELTGDFINAKDLANTTENAGYENLFASPETTLNAGVIAFIGKDNKQTIRKASTVLPILANGSALQKATYYIAFPTLRIEKTVSDLTFDPRTIGYVAVDSTAAVSINNLVAPKNETGNLLGTNRFVVEGGYDQTYTNKLNMGHALIKAVDETNTDLTGYSQVNLTMYKYDGTTDDGLINTSTHQAGTSGANTLRNAENKNYMTGFTPPFSKMAADYLFYHVYMKPNQYSLHSYEGAIGDPFSIMNAGYGYFMSMDVTDYDNARIDTRWDDIGVKAVNRARGGFEFNRRLMRQYFNEGNVANYTSSTDYMKGFSRYAADNSNDAIKGIKAAGWSAGNGGNGNAVAEGIDEIKYLGDEKFSVGDVTVNLVSGLNFLGNPFMTPISLNPLLGLSYRNETDGVDYPDATGDLSLGAAVDISGLFGSGVKTSLQNYTGENVLRSKYWIINNALIQYMNSDGLYHMTVNYDFISTDGTTLTAGAAEDNGVTRVIQDPGSFLIAPMQMFVLQANKDFPITLSPKLRTFGKTRFLKSSGSASYLSDFFVVEVENPVAKNTDRTAVILRESSNLAKTDIYDTNKNLSESITLPSDKDRMYPEEGSSFIYTKSSDGTSMLGNGVPLNVKELALYVTPPATQQNMKLNFYNLENMLTVPNVWLIDRYENNKTVKLTPDYVYEFSSGPSDLTELSGENRFILRFYETDDDVVKEENPITCYYNTSVLHISGLNENDVNSDVYVYDMQGRLIGRTKVNNYPSMEYLKPLSLGTYVVKISGKRNFTSKFVNLQN